MRGLDSAEAARRLHQFGHNELPHADARGVVRVLIDVLREPMFLLLVLAAGLYLFLGSLEEGLVLLASAVVAVGIVMYQSHRTERVLIALRDLSSPRALVIRDGAEQRIAGGEVVPGDIVLINEGDRVPADAILLRGHDVAADESLLTGESMPVRKVTGRVDSINSSGLRPGGDDRPYLYSGSLIVKGQGAALVTATGGATELGKIGRSVQSIRQEISPMQKHIVRLVRTMAILGAALSVAVVVLYGAMRDDWIDGLLAGITVEMSMLPEEFPMVLTVFMALGAWRLSKHRVLTRRSSAIETLGSATVLCVDKTGTLTENRMRVQRIYANGAVHSVIESQKTLPEDFHEVIEYAVLASKPRAFDPMEQAVQRLGNTALLGTEHLHADWRLAQEYELTPGFLAMSQAWSDKAGGQIAAAKGAPEAIADLCHLNDAQIAEWMHAVRQMARDGLRVIAVARASYGGEQWPANQHDLDFAPVGLIGLADPLRAGVPEAIARCRAAGIRVAMMTGDYPETARSIAEQAGLATEDGVLSGADIAALDDVALRKRITDVHVFARVVPEQKLRIVRALKANGEIVAMTGDGVNDAPALKAAHVGIAMGGRGTDVARESAAIVLLQDDFDSIVSAIALGRRIYANMRKAMAYILAIHIPIAGLALLPLLFGLPPLFFPMHIVFLEMFIDPVCSIVFEAEPEEADAMRQPPRPPDQPIFSGARLWLSLLQGCIVLATSIAVYVFALLNLNDSATRTVTFVALVAGNIGLVLVNRSWHVSALRTLRRHNPALWIAMGATVVTLASLLAFPATRALFHFGAVPAIWLALSVVAGIAATLWFDLAKRSRALRTL